MKKTVKTQKNCHGDMILLLDDILEGTDIKVKDVDSYSWEEKNKYLVLTLYDKDGNAIDIKDVR